MNDVLTVIAKKGSPCPKDGKPREYISDSYVSTVPNTPYYRRRLSDGSLLPAVAESGIDKGQSPSKKGNKK